MPTPDCYRNLIPSFPLYILFYPPNPTVLHHFTSCMSKPELYVLESVDTRLEIYNPFWGKEKMDG